MTRLRATVMLGAGLVVGLGTVLLLLPAGPAAAHPLGNFSVNQLAALSLHPDRVAVAATVDAAELPTLQEKSNVDASGDGSVSADERAAHARRGCAEFGSKFRVAVNGDALVWTIEGTGFEYAAGAAGLATSRLSCRLSAAAPLGSPARMRVDNGYRTDRVGWRELTAVGDGVRLIDSPLPATSRSGGDLRSYPQDLLSSPPDVRGADLRVEPGAAAGPAEAAATAGAGGDGSWLTRLVSAGERRLDSIVGERGLTPWIGVFAVGLALMLGAAHAALPGHGKTVMAAYLAGKRGRPRDAVAVGAVVTLTHTGGVLVVGLLLTSVVGLAGQTVLGWLGVASGALVVGVGAAMLLGLRRRRGGPAHHHDGHGHHHHGHHHHGHDHHGHDHHGRGAGRPSRLGVAAIGVAGGLVPSPSALIILLGAVGLGRTLFGVLLVIAYGLGMAGTLTVAGLLLVGVRRRWAGRPAPGGRWRRWTARLAAAAPAATGSLVLLVGLGLVGRAATALV
ncbi:MAG TPA: hypothetical protein VFR67_10660 [Pilimelia sp.]|nr:hypothetical protein [Pilimelia sp.]